MLEQKIIFTAKDGMCPFYILENTKYYIEDCKINNEWKYVLCSKKIGATNKIPKHHPCKVVERFLRMKGIKNHKQHSNGDYVRYYFSNKMIIYNNRELSIQFCPKEIAGYFDSYKECLDYAKKYITENFIDTQIRL